MTNKLHTIKTGEWNDSVHQWNDKWQWGISID